VLINFRLILEGAIEFDHAKLMSIFNEMDRSKAAYLLNSATPGSHATKGQGVDNKI
jgi:hypothetical protein